MAIINYGKVNPNPIILRLKKTRGINCMKFDKVKDSGAREDMETGSRRDTQVGKSRPDLMNPLVLRRVGMHFANGCDKYGEKNFELGQKSSRYRASLGRHLLDYDEGLKDEDHLAAIIWNAMCIMMNQEFVERGIYPPGMDDHSDYQNLDGFESTVGARARAHNEKLRMLEQQTDPKLPDPFVPCDDPDCPCREDGEDLEDVPELPVCFGNCEDADNGCDDCIDNAECNTHLCHECDFDDVCNRVYYCNPTIAAMVVGCRNCMSWDKDYNTWPCSECERNHDIGEEDKLHDFYHTLDEFLC